MGYNVKKAKKPIIIALIIAVVIFICMGIAHTTFAPVEIAPGDEMQLQNERT